MNKNLIEKLTRKAKEDNVKKIVVGALILKSKKLLVLKRKDEDFMGGIYEIPSGNLKQGEDLLEGLKREIKEETNFDLLEVVEYIDRFDYLSKSGKKARQFNFYVRIKPGKVVLSEHTDYAWIDKKDPKFNKLTLEVRKTIQRLYETIGEKNDK